MRNNRVTYRAAGIWLCYTDNQLFLRPQRLLTGNQDVNDSYNGET